MTHSSWGLGCAKGTAILQGESNSVQVQKWPLESLPFHSTCASAWEAACEGGDSCHRSNILLLPENTERETLCKHRRGTVCARTCWLRSTSELVAVRPSVQHSSALTSTTFSEKGTTVAINLLILSNQEQRIRSQKTITPAGNWLLFCYVCSLVLTLRNCPNGALTSIKSRTASICVRSPSN